MDIFCASPASTAICSSLEHRSMVRRGPRPIFERHNSYDSHERRKSQPHVPCSSQLPINPRPYYEKQRRSSGKQSDLHRKRSADINDLKSPPGSSRYLLSDSPFIDWLSESEQPVSALVSAEPAKPMLLSSKESPALKSSSSARSHDQVVVLRVSLHCKGCEGKVRKHLSKMEGVRSYSIDLETKKVTVVGDVTPLGVLASVSKVKKAQLWPSSTSSSSLSPSSRWSA
ncbi:Copper transport protein ATX1 [Morella rubra]|uniref:Copper transport protein ATX1 n=1 Tax=Morella rubra TaxID=262757 RepID=A0A6A1WLA7_9ROSI|nr:Copper transport protein ATX1 [Morella rubra]